MDAELRDALKEIKENQRDGIVRLEAKIDAANGVMGQHIIMSATNYQKISASLDRAHERIDETDAKLEKHKAWHKEERAKWWGVWVGVGTALLASCWKWIEKFFTKEA